MSILLTLTLFIITAIAEIIGCYLPYLWLRENKSCLLLIPAAISLVIFVSLLSLHPTESGRTYAAYGGVYVSVALFWLWLVDGVKPGIFDYLGIACMLLGSLIIFLAPRSL